MARVTDEERKALLNLEVGARVLEGNRVESRSDFEAVFVRGRRVNHILHLLLCIPTVGLWLIVWAVLAVFGGEERHVVRVDEQGHLHQSPPWD